MLTRCFGGAGDASSERRVGPRPGSSGTRKLLPCCLAIEDEKEKRGRRGSCGPTL